jgi:hypothetical protein
MDLREEEKKEREPPLAQRHRWAVFLGGFLALAHMGSRLRNAAEDALDYYSPFI